MSKYPGRIVTDLAPAGYSVAFDGTGDYLSIANNAALNVGSGDFCIEAWFNVSTVASQQVIVSNAGASGSDNTQIDIVSGNIRFASSATVWLTGNAVTTNTWNHVTVSRSGTTMSLFLNGSRQATATNSTNFANANNYATIVGGYPPSTASITGYISNVRIVKGSSVYDPTQTTLRTPTQLFNITNTSLLTCNSPAIVDQSTNNFAITVNGNAAVSTLTPFTAYVPYNPALGAATPGVWTVDEAMQAAATRQWNMYDPAFNLTTLLLHGNPTNGTSFITDASTNNFTVTPVGDTRAANLSPFSLTTFATSGSAYLDGTGDYINLGGQSAFSFGTGDWTVEFWMNFSATGGTLFDTRPAGTASTNGYSVLFLSSGSVRYDTASGVKITGSTLSANTWYHVALSKASGVTRLFINGVQDGSSYTDSVNYGVGANRPIIGADGNIPTSVLFTGYLSNYRIVKGVGVYTGNFTTPTAPLTATQAAGTNISAITGTQTSLLTLQNSQSANNNAFLDSSSNNFLITRNGNTTQGSFTPFSQTGWSNFFNGSSDNLTFNASSAGAFGTGDFTVELWVYKTASGDTSVIDARTSNAAIPWVVDINSDIPSWYNGSANQGTTAISQNVWNHIAFCRSGTTHRIFINGIQTHSFTDSTNYSSQGSSAPIGRNLGTGSPRYFPGYISNLRIVKGTALYSSAFTPSATPLTAVTNTSLLTCQSNRFVDNSSSSLTIAVAGGTPSVQAFSPFYPTVAYTPQTIGGSGYFDGSGDYLTGPAPLVPTASTSTFSCEGWFYPTTLASTIWLIGDMAPTTGTAFLAINIQTSGAVQLYWFDGASKTCNSTRNMVVNQWNWFSVVVNANAINIYVNSTAAGQTGTTTLTNRTGATQNFTIGAFNGSVTPNGYVGSLRWSTSARTISTIPVAPYTSDADTRLLINFTNAGVVDSTGDNVFETAGNAQISTAQSKFGGSSMYFDGTGDYLRGVYSPNMILAGDFTIECWINFSAHGNYGGIVSFANGNTLAAPTSGWALVFYQTTDRLYFEAGGGVGVQATNAVTANQWNHVAVVRSGSTITHYLNGVANGSGTSSAAFTPLTTDNFVIGSNRGFDSSMTGYLDDIRISRYARYTGNFTPQTSQWQDQ